MGTFRVMPRFPKLVLWRRAHCSPTCHPGAVRTVEDALCLLDGRLNLFDLPIRLFAQTPGGPSR